MIQIECLAFVAEDAGIALLPSPQPLAKTFPVWCKPRSCYWYASNWFTQRHSHFGQCRTIYGERGGTSQWDDRRIWAIPIKKNQPSVGPWAQAAITISAICCNSAEAIANAAQWPSIFRSGNRLHWRSVSSPDWIQTPARTSIPASSIWWYRQRSILPQCLLLH